jgi:hypothetical protein
MMRAPDAAAIHAAELKVARSGQEARDGLRRARVALRATLARPSTLVLAAGAAALLGFWLARRPKRQATPSSGAGVARTASAAGLVGALLLRYGMQLLPFVLQQVRAARQERAAPADRELSLSRWPAPGYPDTGVRH